MKAKEIWGFIWQGVEQVTRLTGIVNFGIHFILLSWILFNSPGRWNDLAPILVIGLLSFGRASRGAK